MEKEAGREGRKEKRKKRDIELNRQGREDENRKVRKGKRKK